ncbi:MAG: radical SAM protein [Chloroflexota bacterium]|nr:MAG: radical SAM protein [Chloroflexota bacterium]
MMRPFVFINTNVTRPPVSPVGLEYVAETLDQAGVPIHILDLVFEADWRKAIRRELGDNEPLAVGLTVRNEDDSSFVSKKSFLPWISEVVEETRKLTAAPIILGGIGFSVMPEAVLEVVRADMGIYGDGEEATLLLAQSLAAGEDISTLPNITYRRKEKIVRNPRVDVNLKQFPRAHRRLFNNRKYEQLGAMVGVETKRGCSEACIFCADPVAKGKKMRLRPPDIVVQELQSLTEQDISWLHLCDSEFNMPLTHAKEICQAIIRHRLNNRLRWYCYCSPIPFDRELASLMKRSGCAGVNFGIDSLCDEQLLRLGRRHRLKDVAELVRILKQEELDFMFDLLAGGPGETEQTVTATISMVKELDIPLAGISVGVRVYPNTPLGKAVANGFGNDELHPRTSSPSEPVFYLSPLLGNEPLTLVQRLVAGDPRFLFLAAPAEKESYNYAGDEFLCQLIEGGNRGAYWDIIRRTKKTD